MEKNAGERALWVLQRLMKECGDGSGADVVELIGQLARPILKQAKGEKKLTAVVTIAGGVAELYKNPLNASIEIVDYDNLDEGDGTGDERCLCRLGGRLCKTCVGVSRTIEGALAALPR